MTGSNLDVALGFWQRFLNVEPRWRTLLDRPYLGRIVGYPGVTIDAAFLDLPDGMILEILEYRSGLGTPLPRESGNPGHVHLCIGVDDIEEAYTRAIAAGATAVCADGPQLVDVGPNRGAAAVYLRIPPDGASVELFRPPRALPSNKPRPSD